MKPYKYTVLLFPLICLTACQNSPNNNFPTPPVVAPAVTAVAPVVSPEIDNSKLVPDCITAGNRIEQYVEVGMSGADVRRLVGKPKRSQGSSWGWAEGSASYPGVRFRNDVVTTYGADTSRC